MNPSKISTTPHQTQLSNTAWQIVASTTHTWRSELVAVICNAHKQCFTWTPLLAGWPNPNEEKPRTRTAKNPGTARHRQKLNDAQPIPTQKTRRPRQFSVENTHDPQPPLPAMWVPPPQGNNETFHNNTQFTPNINIEIFSQALDKDDFQWVKHYLYSIVSSDWHQKQQSTLLVFNGKI